MLEFVLGALIGAGARFIYLRLRLPGGSGPATPIGAPPPEAPPAESPLTDPFTVAL